MNLALAAAISSAVLGLLSLRGVLGAAPLEQKLASFRYFLVLQLVALGVMMVFVGMAPEPASKVGTLAADPTQAADPAQQAAQWLHHSREHRELRERLLAPLIWLLGTLLPAVPLLRALQSFVLAHRLDLDTRHRIAAASAEPQR